MQSSEWLNLWGTWKTQGIFCWIGAIVLFYKFWNDGIWLLAPISAVIGYSIFTYLCYTKVKQIKAGKFIDKRLTDKEIEKKSNRSLIMLVICMIGIVGFSVYILIQITSSVDTEMTGNNSTHNCIEASGILYSEKTGIPIKPSKIPFESSIVDKAQQAWSRDSCDSVTLTDDFGNQCLGSVGLAYYGETKDGFGQWYCQNIPKDTLVQKTIIH